MQARRERIPAHSILAPFPVHLVTPFASPPALLHPMPLAQTQRTVQRQQQRADPQLLLTNRLLQMPQLELQQCLVLEQHENPALEPVLEGGCGECDHPNWVCIGCPWSGGRPDHRGHGDEAGEAGGARRQGEDDFDPVALAVAPETLRDSLRWQARAVLDGADLQVGLFLIDNVDEDGYLRCDPSEAVTALAAPPAQVQAVLRAIQSLEPTGVGARNLQECLLIQARAAREEADSLAGARNLGAEAQGACSEGAALALVEEIIGCYWKELGAGRVGSIARRLHVPQGQVEKAIQWLRSNLSPYPGRRYRTLGQCDPDQQRVRPDLRVCRDDHDQLRMELVGRKSAEIRLNTHYLGLWQRMREAPTLFSPGEINHVQEYVLRARRLVQGVHDRSLILQQLGERLLVEQEPYFRSEQDEDMRSLSQAQLASFLQVHESTVSRAVADKFLELLSGRVVPLSYFFDRSLSHRRLIANIVAAEDPNAPYSDQEIAALLHEQGVRVARRTVLKYREELNILSSRQRARSRTT